MTSDVYWPSPQMLLAKNNQKNIIGRLLAAAAKMNASS